MPDGLPTRSARSRMMNTLLQTTASVIATCSTISATPVLLRISAEKMGLMSMAMASVRLQLRRGRDAARAPRGIDAGGDAGGDRDERGDDDHAGVEPREQPGPALV